jgi:hypothetical protein
LYEPPWYGKDEGKDQGKDLGKDELSKGKVKEGPEEV